jgi:hypothetical protein
LITATSVESVEQPLRKPIAVTPSIVGHPAYTADPHARIVVIKKKERKRTIEYMLERE